jgi:hypothetical protein
MCLVSAYITSIQVNSRRFSVLETMATMASNSSSMSSAAKESLLLSHAESTDEWAGWCTVESEPV